MNSGVSLIVWLIGVLGLLAALSLRKRRARRSSADHPTQTRPRAAHAPVHGPLSTGFLRCDIERVVLGFAAPDGASFRDLADAKRRGTRIAVRAMRVYTLSRHRGTTILLPDVTPDYPRIDAAEALALLEELPDIRLVRRLLIVDDIHPAQPWKRQVSGVPTLEILAESSPEGDITLYRPGVGEDVFSNLAHEWCHILRKHSPQESDLFTLAASLEDYCVPDGAAIAHYAAAARDDERWARLGQVLIGRDRWHGPLYAMGNRIQASILWRALERRLSTLTIGQRGPRHDDHLGLGEVMDLVRAGAREDLQKLSASPGSARADAAKRIAAALFT